MFPPVVADDARHTTLPRAGAPSSRAARRGELGAIRFARFTRLSRTHHTAGAAAREGTPGGRAHRSVDTPARRIGGKDFTVSASAAFQRRIRHAIIRGVFLKLGLRNPMRKTNFHRLAEYVPESAIDPEIREKLDAISAGRGEGDARLSHRFGRMGGACVVGAGIGARLRRLCGIVRARRRARRGTACRASAPGPGRTTRRRSRRAGRAVRSESRNASQPMVWPCSRTKGTLCERTSSTALAPFLALQAEAGVEEPCIMDAEFPYHRVSQATISAARSGGMRTRSAARM